MTWNGLQNEACDGAAVTVRLEDLACVLFARDRDQAQQHCATLEEYGIFAQIGETAACGDAASRAAVGVPIVVSSHDQERANMILASLEAIGSNVWDDDDEDDDIDDDDDDDDEVFPDGPDDFDDEPDDEDDEDL